MPLVDSLLIALALTTSLVSVAESGSINAPPGASLPSVNSRSLPSNSVAGKVPSVETQSPGMAIDTGNQGGTGAVPCPQFCATVEHQKGDVYYTCSWGSYGPKSSPFVEYVPYTRDYKTCLTAGVPLDVEPRHRLFVHGLHANNDTWNHWSARIDVQMKYMGYKTVRDNTGSTKEWGDGTASLLTQVGQLAGQVNAGFGGVGDGEVDAYVHSLGALKMEALLQLGYMEGLKCNWNVLCASPLFQAARKIGRVYVFQGAHGGCAATQLNGDYPNHAGGSIPGSLSGCPASKDIGSVNDGHLYLGMAVIPGTPTPWDMNAIVWRGRGGQEKHIHYVVAHSNGGAICKGAEGFLCRDNSAHDGVVYAWQMVPTWYPNYENARQAGYVSSSPGGAEPGHYCHMRIGNDKEDSYDPPRLSDELMYRYVGIRPGLKYLVPTGRVANSYSRDVIVCPDSCFCTSDPSGACRNHINCARYGGFDCSAPPSGGGTSAGSDPFGGPVGPATIVFRLAPSIEPTSWTVCASEGGACAFPGTRQVRYGANGVYVMRTFSNGTRCNSDVFGDPVPGFTKACEYGDEKREPLPGSRPPG
jgi:hypothetical protein